MFNDFQFYETFIKIDKLNTKIEGGGFSKKRKKEGGGFQGVGLNSLTNKNRVRSKSGKPCDMNGRFWSTPTTIECFLLI